MVPAEVHFYDWGYCTHLHSSSKVQILDKLNNYHPPHQKAREQVSAMLSDGGRDAATNLSCINYAHQAKVDLRDHRIIITIIITIIIIINNRPKPAYGRQGLAGSWGQDTDQAGTFWGVVNISLRAFSAQLG